LHRETLEIFRELGDKVGASISLHRLGRLAFARGQYEAAATFYRQSLELAQAVGNKALMAFSIGGLGGVAAEYGRPHVAARLFGAAQAMLDTVSSNLESTGVAKPVPVVRALLGETAWDTEWAAGQALPLETAVGEALGVPTREV